MKPLSLTKCMAGGGMAFTDTAQNGGVTVRDYFAAKALHVSVDVLRDQYGNFSPEDVAEMSYEIADAMMKVRAA